MIQIVQKCFFSLSFPIWLYKGQERILSCFIIIVIFSLDHVKNYASVNSSCAQPPPPSPHGLTPGHWHFVYLGWQIPGGGDSWAVKSPGVGTKIEGKCPVSLWFKGLFTWSGGPQSSGVDFFCFHPPGATKQKKPTPLDRGPPLHANRVLENYRH